MNESREEAGRRAEQRAKELSELRLRLSAGGLLTADDIELAQLRADEAQQRAKAAHLSAAQRHEEARRTHERAAEAHLRAANAGIGDRAEHERLADRYRLAADQDLEAAIADAETARQE